MDCRKFFLVGAALLSMSACANLQTIGRSTPFGENGARAIHLDAQQRLVLTSKDKFCAEPSPDALAAYASSLGLGVGVPGQGAGSAAQAVQSATGSIGLRTQSITLMRDALYRMCEANNNGALNALEVAAFLRRSQDLTAVVLAIEQLTGAVSARQVTLTPSAGSSASASVVSNQQLLDEATKNHEAKKTAVTDAEEERDKAKTASDAAKTKKEAEEGKLAALKKQDPAAKEDDIKQQASVAKRAAEDLSAKEKALNNAENKVATAKKLRDQAKEVKDTIEASRGAALTNATANTNSSSQFSAVGQQYSLSKEATQTVANAVQNMVKAALDKSYTPDLCMSYLTHGLKFPDGVTVPAVELEKLAQTCLEILIVRNKSEAEAIVLSAGQKAAINVRAKPLSNDPSVEKLNQLLGEGKTTVVKIVAWLKTVGVPQSQFVNFKNLAEFDSLRNAYLQTNPK